MKPITETIDLNTTNQLRITLNEFKGKLRLDVRHYWRDGVLPDTEWRPSKKGINIGEDDFGPFRKHLDRAFSKVELEDESSEF